MSFETISIAKNLPIINGYVVTPQALEKNRNCVSILQAIDVAGQSSLKRFDSGSSGHSTAGGKFGSDEFIQVISQPIVDSRGNITPGTVDMTVNVINELVS